MYTIICKMDCSPGLMNVIGFLGTVYWNDPEGWDGEGGGSGIKDGEQMYTYGGFICQCMAKPLQYCKVISLQLK